MLAEQASLLDETWQCPTCEGTGREPRDTSRCCPMCLGAQCLYFDPTDLSVIPF